MGDVQQERIVKFTGTVPEDGMRIVANTTPLLSPLTGVGNYIYSLLKEFNRLRPDNDYRYYYGYFSKKIRLYSPKRRGLYLAKKFISNAPVLGPLARQLRQSVTRLHRNEYDVYFEPNFIPLNIEAKRTVTTVCDFSFHEHPEWHPEDRIRFFRKNFFERIKRSDVIITISRFVEQKAHELLDVANANIVSIYPGHGPMFCTSRDRDNGLGLEIPENYVLFVGSLEPRKNLKNLLKSYMLLPDYVRKEFKLLLVGFRGWKNRDVMELLAKLQDNVTYLGYVSNEELAALYRKASCFVYPSFYEGFGLPPLEAMACGCPVVVSNVTSLPEVCGNAAQYVDPHDIESIAHGLSRILMDEDLRQTLSAKGPERASLFSWEECARRHLAIFEEA